MRATYAAVPCRMFAISAKSSALVRLVRVRKEVRRRRLQRPVMLLASGCLKILLTGQLKILLTGQLKMLLAGVSWRCFSSMMNQGEFSRLISDPSNDSISSCLVTSKVDTSILSQVLKIKPVNWIGLLSVATWHSVMTTYCDQQGWHQWVSFFCSQGVVTKCTLCGIVVARIEVNPLVVHYWSIRCKLFS